MGLSLGLSLAVVEGSGVTKGGGAHMAHSGGMEGDSSAMRLSLPLADDMRSAAVASGLCTHPMIGTDHGAPGPLELTMRISLGLSESHGSDTGDNLEIEKVLKKSSFSSKSVYSLPRIVSCC